MVADPSNASTTCTAGTLTADAGTGAISYTGGSVGAGVSCTVQVDVTSTTEGDHVNTTGDLTSSSGNSGTATDTLTVLLPPLFDKVFTPGSIEVGQVSTLTFTIDNTASAVTASALDFTDNLPAGVVVADPSNASTTCTGGTLTADAGTGVVSYTGGSAGAGASCTVQVDVTSSTQGDHVNTTGDLTSTSGNSGTATDTLTVTLPPLFDKVFAPGSIEVGQVSTLTFTIDNSAGVFAADSFGFTDNFPAGVVIADPTNASTDCSGMGDATAGASSFSFVGSVAAGSSCTIELDVTSSTQGDHVNTTGDLTSTSGNSGTATDTLTVTLPPLFDKVFAPDSIEVGQVSTLTFTIDNTAGVFAADSFGFTDNFPAGVVIADPTNASTDCSGMGDATAGASSFSFVGSVAAGSSCTIELDVTSSTQGDHVNTTGDLTSTSGNSGTATDTLTVTLPPLFDKVFAPDSIEVGQVSTLTFTIDNTAGVFAADSVGFTDNFPAGVVIADPTNASTDCTGMGDATAGASSFSFVGSVAAGSSCTIQLDVTSSTQGDHVNTTGDLTSTSGNSGTATDTLRVTLPPLFDKVFAPNEIEAGEVSTLTLTIDNSASVFAAADVDFTDNLPAGVVVADPSSASTTCTGGTLTAASASDVISYTGGSVGAGASCTVQVDVTSVTAGMHVNTTGDLTSSSGNSGTATDTLTVTPPPPPTFSKTFDGITTATGTPVLTFTITNPASALSASDLSFTDDLDAVIAGLSATNTTLSDVCGTGSSLSGTSVLTLAGGDLGPMSSCSFDVELLVPVSATAGTFTNTTSDLLQGGVAVADPATADLTVEPPPVFAKAFTPDSIVAGEVSTLTFTIDNSASALDANSLDFTDNLPPRVIVANPANASTDCTGGTLTAASLSDVISYTGGSVGAGASCTVQVNVRALAAGDRVNTTSDLTSSSGNSGTATDTLTIAPPPAPTFDKVFAPDSFESSQTSTLTFTIDNSASALHASRIDFTDNLPAAVTVASPAAASTTCFSGTLTAVPGSGVISFTDGIIVAGATCTVQVDVTGLTPGDHVNTTGDLTSSAGNSGTATDTLTITPPPPPSFDKVFAPDVVIPTGVSTLTFSIDNTVAPIAASSLDFTDNLPADLEVAVTPNASTTCTGGTLTAAAGSSVISYTGGLVAAGSTCNVQVDVTPTTSALFVNTSGDLTSAFGNSGSATDTLDSRLMLEGEPLMPGLNELTIGNGVSDGLVLLLQGTQPGSQMLTVQGVQITTAFADPFPIGFAEVNTDGTATIQLNISESQVGQTLQYQAFQLLPILTESDVLELPVVTTPLLVEGGEGAGAEAISADALPALTEIAIQRWAATGLSAAQLDTLRAAEIQLADLPVGVLGSSRDGRILIDFNAAGHGWFVDPTPEDRSEFEVTVAPTEFAAGANSPAAGSVDLLTVITHEFGHFLGFEDIPPEEADNQIMASELAEGTRRVTMAWQNPTDPLDVNDDNDISPIDALIIFNTLNDQLFGPTGRLPIPEAEGDRRFLDTSGDGVVSAIDALQIINHINDEAVAAAVDLPAAEGEGSVGQEAVDVASLDIALLDLQTEQRWETDAAPRQIAVVDAAATRAIVPASGAKERGLQFAASDAKSADTDLALLEWLEQSSDE